MLNLLSFSCIGFNMKIRNEWEFERGNSFTILFTPTMHKSIGKMETDLLICYMELYEPCKTICQYLYSITLSQCPRRLFPPLSILTMMSHQCKLQLCKMTVIFLLHQCIFPHLHQQHCRMPIAPTKTVHSSLLVPLSLNQGIVL